LFNKVRKLLGKRPLGAPAGRMVNKGWTKPQKGKVSSSGNPMDRTEAVNIFSKVGSRGTLTGIEIKGVADSPFTRFWVTGGTSQGNQKPLFTSNGLQNIDPRGSLRAITEEGGIS